MLHGKVEKAIHNRIENDAIGTKPRSAGTILVHPDVEDFFDWRGDRTGHGDFGKVHRDFSF
jgi:hypothetical protein